MKPQKKRVAPYLGAQAHLPEVASCKSGATHTQSPEAQAVGWLMVTRMVMEREGAIWSRFLFLECSTELPHLSLRPRGPYAAARREARSGLWGRISSGSDKNTTMCDPKKRLFVSLCCTRDGGGVAPRRPSHYQAAFWSNPLRRPAIRPLRGGNEGNEGKGKPRGLGLFWEQSQWQRQETGGAAGHA